MLIKLRKRNGQSTVEYAVLIVVVIAALLSIQVYIKRGISGRMKDSADQIGSQFEYLNTNAETVTTTLSNTTESYKTGVSKTSLRADEKTTTNTTVNIIDVNKKTWK